MTEAALYMASRAALAELIDYAGLFPPAQFDMATAAAEYAAIKAGPLAWMAGRFILPASRIPEFISVLPDDAAPQSLSVILDAGSDARTWLSGVQQLLGELARACKDDKRLQPGCLEVALPPLQAQRETYDAAIGQFAAARQQAGFGAPAAFVELPRDARWMDLLPGALAAMGRHHLGAKLRCGGLVAQAFPSVDEVAFFIGEAASARVPFKATAGLHHPIRRHDPVTGAMMHGFLNVLTAAALGEDIARVLACEDAKAFALDEQGLRFEDRRITTDDLRAARSERFISYGSCSFEEPVCDLQTLGML
jgi:hypothetical protein